MQSSSSLLLLTTEAIAWKLYSKLLGMERFSISIDISRRFNPVVVEIDVSNVNWIEFYVGEGSDYFSPIYALIADAQLTK